ncbi:hypothetical protein Hanom_Chr09g00830981 [Helianthus anomalus]
MSIAIDTGHNLCWYCMALFFYQLFGNHFSVSHVYNPLPSHPSVCHVGLPKMFIFSFINKRFQRSYAFKMDFWVVLFITNFC